MHKATCSLDDCSRAHYARGYCKAHYKRVAKFGDPQAWKPLRKLPNSEERDDILGRIMAKSAQTEAGCIEWHGARSESGYGHVSWEGRSWLVHRAVWTVVVGPIPSDDDWTIDHLCSNRACVNVGHLEVVTRTENSNRGGGLKVAIQTRRAVTHCKHGHEFTDANTIRLSSGSRLCRQCNKRRWAEKSEAIGKKRRMVRTQA